MDSRESGVLVDIDGVLCDTDYRPDPVDFSWEDFMKAEQRNIEAGIQLVRCLANSGLTPVFLTARPEMMRYQTEEMLAHFGFHGPCYMASNKTVKNHNHATYLYDHMVEKDRILLENALTEEFRFLYAIDDQELNIAMYKTWGIPTLHTGFVK
jgi:hypothetical protein